MIKSVKLPSLKLNKFFSNVTLESKQIRSQRESDSA